MWVQKDLEYFKCYESAFIVVMNTYFFQDVPLKHCSGTQSDIWLNGLHCQGPMVLGDTGNWCLLFVCMILLMKIIYMHDGLRYLEKSTFNFCCNPQRSLKIWSLEK